jgi:hypothetical protein
MFWTMYDKGTGGTPNIGDKVETCHLGEVRDGEYAGTFAGWSSFDRVAGIVILDKPLKTGELAIAMPPTCLRKIR